MWGGMSLGTYGASMKPKIQQCRVYPNERLATDACLLDDDEDDEMDGLNPDLGNVFGKPVAVKQVKPEPVVKKLVEEEEEEEDEVEEVEEEMEVEEEPIPEPVKPVRTTKVITTKKK
jgi:hypothetical protein